MVTPDQERVPDCQSCEQLQDITDNILLEKPDEWAHCLAHKLRLVGSEASARQDITDKFCMKNPKSGHIVKPTS